MQIWIDEKAPEADYNVGALASSDHINLMNNVLKQKDR